MVPRFATLGRIPKGVWVLGGVSLLMETPLGIRPKVAKRGTINHS
jgi:hypothetical protein